MNYATILCRTEDFKKVQHGDEKCINFTVPLLSYSRKGCEITEKNVSLTLIETDDLERFLVDHDNFIEHIDYYEILSDEQGYSADEYTQKEISSLIKTLKI